MKILAIGDIHTKIWIIESVRNVIQNYDAVVFVGDYADDWSSGPLSTIETWRALRQLQFDYPSKVHIVMGNHDYIYVNYTSSISSGYNRTTQILIDSPEMVDLKIWLKDIPVVKSIDGVTFSHAGIGVDYDESLQDLWDDRSPLWARPDYTVYKDFPQVFGHTPSQTCWEVQPNVWCIDTFSTYRDGSPIGDRTALEVIDGKCFKKIKMENKNDNDSTNRIQI